MEQDNTIRVFIALDLPAEAKQALADTIRHFQSALPYGVRWVDPAGIHLTLKFLGNIDASLVKDIFKATQCAARDFQDESFRLQLSGLGVFPNERQPRVLWAGIDGDLDSLKSLQEKVDEAISRLGFPREKRPFNPHLTLGRVRDDVSASARRQVSAAFAAADLEPGDPWKVKEVHLIRSTLTPNGAIYTSLGSTSLSGF
jgi:RNA 2',3'-cyclic 3'-phosphodiesterase